MNNQEESVLTAQYWERRWPEWEKWFIAAQAEAVTQKELDIIEKEFAGGKCDKCGKEWKMETITITLDKELTFSHYMPVCKCYTQCVCCDRYLIIEQQLGLFDCTSCWLENKPSGIKWTLQMCGKIQNVKNARGEEKKIKCDGLMKLRRDGLYQCDSCGRIARRTKL